MASADDLEIFGSKNRNQAGLIDIEYSSCGGSAKAAGSVK